MSGIVFGGRSEKITVRGDDDPRYDRNEGTSEITTKDGHKFEKHIVWPRGDGESRMANKDLEDKFREMATKRMGKEQIKQVFDPVWNAEKLDDINKSHPTPTGRKRGSPKGAPE